MKTINRVLMVVLIMLVIFSAGLFVNAWITGIDHAIKESTRCSYRYAVFSGEGVYLDTCNVLSQNSWGAGRYYECDKYTEINTEGKMHVLAKVCE